MTYLKALALWGDADPGGSIVLEKGEILRHPGLGEFYLLDGDCAIWYHPEITILQVSPKKDTRAFPAMTTRRKERFNRHLVRSRVSVQYGACRVEEHKKPWRGSGEGPFMSARWSDLRANHGSDPQDPFPAWAVDRITWSNLCEAARIANARNWNVEHLTWMAALAENPFDLSAWLIYADWLEERENASCENVRALCRGEIR